MFTKTLEGAAEDAGVDRPVTFTSFRKSSASYLALQGMNQAHIEDHHGWVRGSDVASRYVSVFGQDAHLISTAADAERHAVKDLVLSDTST